MTLVRREGTGANDTPNHQATLGGSDLPTFGVE